MDFPFGQGADFAGHIEAAGSGVSEFAVGDDVLGWSDQRSAHAEFVAITSSQLIAKPPSLDWYRAGSLFVAGTTAFAAVRAVSLKAGDVVAISGAAGGVGSLAVQLARRTGARPWHRERRQYGVLGVGRSGTRDLRRWPCRPAPRGGAERNRRVHRSLRSRLYRPRDRTRRAEGPHRHDHRFRRRRKASGQDRRFGRGRRSEDARTPCGSHRVGRDRHADRRDLPVRDAYVELAKRKTHGKIVLDLSGKVSKPLRP